MHGQAAPTVEFGVMQSAAVPFHQHMVPATHSVVPFPQAAPRPAYGWHVPGQVEVMSEVHQPLAQSSLE